VTATPDIWRTSEELAEVLRASPDIEALQRVFDRDSRQRDDPRPYERAIEHYVASMGMLRTRPLLFGLHAPQLPSIDMPPPTFGDLLKLDGFPDFLRSAQRAAGALLSLVEYLRSRLPGYPDLPLPELRPQAPRVERDGLLDASSMPWPMAARARGVERHGPSPSGLRGVDEPAWRERAEGLLAHLSASCEWSAFAVVTDGLSPDDRQQLDDACRRFDERTQLDAIHANAGPLLLRQGQHRRAALDEACASLTDEARGYLDAFDAIDCLIDQAALVISDRAIYAEAIRVPADADVSWQRTDSGVTVRARFSEGASPFIQPGRLLIYAGDPPVVGGWICQGTRFGWQRDLDATVDLDAKVLPDSVVLARPAFDDGAGGNEGDA
jgi:hypothetical protein